MSDNLFRPFEPKHTIDEAREFMLQVLPTEANPDIDKYAILLRPVDGQQIPGPPKMIGLVGTNRKSPQGLETGYCMNIKYWGHGYANEAFGAFLEGYWKLESKIYYSS